MKKIRILMVILAAALAAPLLRAQEKPAAPAASDTAAAATAYRVAELQSEVAELRGQLMKTVPITRVPT